MMRRNRAGSLYLLSLSAVLGVCALAATATPARADVGDIFLAWGSDSYHPHGGVGEYKPDGTFVGAFVQDPTTFGTEPLDIAFGPNGDLFAGNYTGGAVTEYDGKTGAFVGNAVTGLVTPWGMAFDKSGNMYVTDAGTGLVDKVSLATHSVVQTYNLGSAISILMRSNGDLLVTRAGDIANLDPTNGNITEFTGVTGRGLVQGPDGRYYINGGGNIYVVGSNGGAASVWANISGLGHNNASSLAFSHGNFYADVEDNLAEFNGSTGAFMQLIPVVGHNLQGMTVLAPVPEAGTMLSLGAMLGAGCLCLRRAHRRRG